MTVASHLCHFAAVGLAFAGAIALGEAAAAQTGNFELELNAAVDMADACQLTFVASNNTGLALTKASYEVAVFDSDGLVSSLFVFEFGELPMNKTRVVLFALPELTCNKVSRLLVNRQDECQSAEGPQDICMKALNTSSRIATIPFGL